MKFKVPVLWDLKKIEYNWEQNFAFDRYKEKEVWDKPTDEADFLDKCYKIWDVSRDGTKHYHSHKNKLNFDEKILFNLLPGINHKYNFFKITPGNTIPWHFDTYRNYIVLNNIDDVDSKNVRRILIFLEDRKIGQILQFGKKIVSNWKAGDALTWNRNLWHGACNFGNKDLIVLQVTFLINEDDDRWRTSSTAGKDLLRVK